MKKLLLSSAFVVFLVLSCGKKETAENATTTEGTENVTTNPTTAVQETITDADKYEGKVVESEPDAAGVTSWFVIKDGERYRAMSEPATTDYLESIKDGNNHVYNRVPLKTLEQFPIVGEILPGVKFKRDK